MLSTQVMAVDITPPILTNCPSSTRYQVPYGTRFHVATWTEPIGSDNSPAAPTVFHTHGPGDEFPVGITQVSYIFLDSAGNEAVCSFTITGKESYVMFVLNG